MADLDPYAPVNPDASAPGPGSGPRIYNARQQQAMGFGQEYQHQQLMNQLVNQQLQQGQQQFAAEQPARVAQAQVAAAQPTAAGDIASYMTLPADQRAPYAKPFQDTPTEYQQAMVAKYPMLSYEQIANTHNAATAMVTGNALTGVPQIKGGYANQYQANVGGVQQATTVYPGMNPYGSAPQGEAQSPGVPAANSPNVPQANSPMSGMVISGMGEHGPTWEAARKYYNIDAKQNEFRNSEEFKRMSESADAMSQVRDIAAKEAAGTATPQEEQKLIYTQQNLLNPGLGVKQGQYDQDRQAGNSFLDKIKLEMEHGATGRILLPEQVKNISDAAESAYRDRLNYFRSFQQQQAQNHASSGVPQEYIPSIVATQFDNEPWDQPGQQGEQQQWQPPAKLIRDPAQQRAWQAYRQNPNDPRAQAWKKAVMASGQE